MPAHTHVVAKTHAYPPSRMHAQMKAGKMKLVGTTLTPDMRKGTLRLFTAPEDQLLHLTWTSREVDIANTRSCTCMHTTSAH